MSNKNKLLCLGSLLLGFYLISNILPFPGYIDEVFITALAFPFFNRKLRVRITTAVQGVAFLSFVYRTVMMYMKYGGLLTTAIKNKLELGTYFSGPEVSLIPESVSKVGSNLVQSMGIFDQFFLFFKAFYPVESFIYEYLTHGVAVTIVILYPIIALSLFLIGITAPYSIYLIIEKLGFYRLVERNTKGLIDFKEWTT